MNLKKTILFILPVLCMSAFSSCTKGSMNEQEYLTYISDKGSGLVNKAEQDSFEFNTRFIPKKSMVLKEYGTLQKDSIDIVADTYYKDLEFLKISVHDEIGKVAKTIYGSNANYATMINYTGTLLKQDVLMLDGPDTLRCVDAYFEPSHQMTPEFSYLFTFKRKNTSTEYKDVRILFYDRVFSKKEIHFDFKQKDLNTVSRIKII